MFSGTKVRGLRRAKGLTLQKLSKKTGLPWLHIQAYETGRRNNPTALTLEKLASALNVSIDDFFEYDHEGQRPLEIVLERIEELAKKRKLNLPKDIYPLYLFQEVLGIVDNAVFTDILLALAKGRVIELIPVFPCDIKEGMKVYQVPGLGDKKHYSFTIVDRPIPEPEQRSAAKARRRTRKGGR